MEQNTDRIQRDEHGIIRTTEIIRHSEHYSPDAEYVIESWRDFFDGLSYTGKFRYIIHVWQKPECFHIEAGIRTEIDGITYSRAVMIGDSAATQRSFLCIVERERYLGSAMEILLELTERELMEKFGYDGITYDYDLSKYVTKFNDGEPVLLRENGKRYDRKGHLVMEHPEYTFGKWSPELVSWMM